MDEYIKITWQYGTIPESGINGCQVEDALAVCLDRLEVLNSDFSCVENEVAIAKIKEAIMSLNERTRDREARGVEGTHNP